MIAASLVAVGGAAGALLRYLISRSDGPIPWAMMAINVLASGLAASLGSAGGEWRWLAQVGFLGALSTWSTLALAVVRLVEADRRADAALVLGGTVATSVALAMVVLQLT